MEFNLKRARKLSVLLLFHSHKYFLWFMPGVLMAGIVLPLFLGGFSQLIMGDNSYRICKLGITFSGSMWFFALFFCLSMMGMTTPKESVMYQQLPASIAEKFFTPLGISLISIFGIILPLFIVGTIIGDCTYMAFFNYFDKSSPHFSMHDIAIWGFEAFFWSNSLVDYILGNLLLMGISLCIIFSFPFNQMNKIRVALGVYITNILTSTQFNLGKYSILNFGNKLEYTPEEHVIKMVIIFTITVLVWVITYKVYSKRQIN